MYNRILKRGDKGISIEYLRDLRNYHRKFYNDLPKLKKYKINASKSSQCVLEDTLECINHIILA